MKVRVLKKTKIGGKVFMPSPEILEVWPMDARKGIIKGDLEDVQGDFIEAYRAKQTYIKKKERK